jgi:hypothetical protein
VTRPESPARALSAFSTVARRGRRAGAAAKEVVGSGAQHVLPAMLPTKTAELGSSGRERGTSRIVSFSDGVFAIAITGPPAGA